MPSPNNVLTADSYIQDGLVFQLDGIEYGGVDGQWIDRKSGIIASLFNVSRNGNGFYFSSNSKALFSESIMPTTVQIDMLFYYTDFNGMYFNPRSGLQSSSRALRCYWVGRQNRLNIGAISAKEYAAMARFTNQDISISEAKLIANGRNFQIINFRSWPNDSHVAGILPYNEESDRPYNGTIYTIRVYNRQLSNREILINQHIDNTRFGLSLDIPDKVLPAGRSLSLLEPFELPDESMTEQDITNDNSDER